MNDNDMDLLLKDLAEAELTAAPQRYNEEEDRYGACPPLWRYREAAANNTWTSAERGHVRQCPNCQKTIAMQWRFTCPDESLLAPAVRENFSEAVRIHLEEQQCGRCRKLVQRLDQAIGTESSWVGSSWFTGTLSLVGGHAQEDVPPFHFRCRTGEPEMEITLREAQGDLLARVQCAGSSQAGQRVRLRLKLSGGEVLDKELTLRDAGEYGSLEEIPFGKFADLASRMAAFQVQALWLDVASGQAGNRAE